MSGTDVDRPDVERFSEPSSPMFGAVGGAAWLRAGTEVLAVLTVSVILVVLAEGSESSRGRLAGVGLSAACLVFLASAAAPPRRWGSVILGLGGTVWGLQLIISPEEQRGRVLMTAGVALAVAGLLTGWAAVRGGRPRRTWTTRAVLVPVGIAVVFASGPLVTVGLWTAALVIAATGLLRAAQRLGLSKVDVGSELPSILGWIAALGQQPMDRDEVYERVYFEGPSAAARVLRFAVLMALASVISAMGVLTDSTAVVIGAMLVAPLITPMMGMGLSLAMGWPSRLGRSLLTVLTGVAIAVIIAWVLASVFSLSVDLQANSQISARSSPTIADLVIAVAAGATGAYALSHRDVSSSLPGVAIAIALVPPLSVVGVAAQRGEWQLAAGTVVLFLTNFVAILLVGGLVFVATGAAPLQRSRGNQHRVRAAVLGVILLAVIVVAALSLNGRNLAAQALDEDEARQAVAAWLGADSAFTVVSLQLRASDVTVVVAGPGDPPPAQRLAGLLREQLDRSVVVDLQWIPRQREIVRAGQ